jgi:cytoskeletal protein CcmA (bactofilin family)
MLKLKGLSSEDLNGFLDDGTEFSGELRFRDVLRVDGRLKGRVVSDNMLIIGETGQVDAEIDCGVVSIRGKVSGQVYGRQRIELLAGCRVMATLVSPKLVIEDGAFFQGECRMGEGATLPPKPAPTPVAPAAPAAPGAPAATPPASAGGGESAN